MTTATLHVGDMRTVLAGMPADSIDSIVCDPPYGLEFMGKGWDHGTPGVEFWTEALRVLKPGGHLLAFGGTRTFHRLTVSIEDAGFEIRDCLMWLYGSGFPKSMDVSKAIDKAAGAEREVVGQQVYGDGHVQNSTESIGFGGSDPAANRRLATAPATPEAQQWDGWGTALKPAWEPIILARRPLDKGHTVAANVLAHGTGAINIDDCRIGTGAGSEPRDGDARRYAEDGQDFHLTPGPRGGSPAGRFPANLLLDDEAAALLDEQTGTLTSGKVAPEGFSGPRAASNTYGTYATNHIDLTTVYGDSGGASRFFYCAKAAKKDRNAGLPDGAKNDHPTVKPHDLMCYLVRLITPPGGAVLDPFVGSGSTGAAAAAEGFDFIGVDLDEHYVNDLAALRIAHAGADVTILGAELAEPEPEPAATNVIDVTDLLGTPGGTVAVDDSLFGEAS